MILIYRVYGGVYDSASVAVMGMSPTEQDLAAAAPVILRLL